MPDTLTVTDNRSGRTLDLPIEEGAVRAAGLRELGLTTYDPGLVNTATVRSAITFIDGDTGILRYRGFPIEQLAVESTFLETACLLLFGELPKLAEPSASENSVTKRTFLHET